MTRRPGGDGMAAPVTRAGGRILVDQLAIHGTSTVYCLPGESYLAALDGLYEHRDTIRVVSCRHEANAANMAVASGKLTGRPGICFVTRGPGATQASVGVHTASQDSTPMILFVGQVPRHHLGREAFQEIPVDRVFGDMAKWAATIDSVERIPEYVARAFQVAMSGRPGPVVLALPEDVLEAEAVVEDAERVDPAEAAPDPLRMDALRDLLQGARRPTVIVGGSGWDAASVAAFVGFAERNHLPVATAFRRQDLFDNTSPSYVGSLGSGTTPSLVADVEQSDVVLLVGARIDAPSTNRYSLLTVPTPRQALAHVHPSADEIGGLAHVRVGVVSSVPAFVRAVSQLEPLDTSAWREWTARRHADRVAAFEAPPSPRQVDIASIIAQLREQMPPDTIYASGAGNFTAWCHRYLRFSAYPSQLAPSSGAMGFGLPAAIAAAVEAPDRAVVAIAGDGDFLMASPDLATAADHGLPIVVIVINNGMFGTIRMHQERRYPGRVIATSLSNPHFADLARAYGWHGEVVTSTDEFEPALARSRKTDGPALIEVRSDPDQLSLETTLSELGVASAP